MAGIMSKPATDAYRENFDRVFGRKTYVLQRFPGLVFACDTCKPVTEIPVRSNDTALTCPRCGKTWAVEDVKMGEPSATRP